MRLEALGSSGRSELARVACWFRVRCKMRRSQRVWIRLPTSLRVNRIRVAHALHMPAEAYVFASTTCAIGAEFRVHV